MLSESRSEFVGRRAELATIGALLGDARLVTLTGVGGVGKTRLALRAANEYARSREVLTWFVALDTLQDPQRVPLTVARALPLGEHSARDPLDFLVDVLADTPAIVVLDNCEHLIDAVSAFADELLDAVPGLTILATSRRRLDVDGEQVYAVPPLSLTEDSAAPSDAVALLLSRARAADAAFELAPREWAVAAELCRALDGLPLAIELAATRLRALPLTDLLGRLSSRFTLLRAAGRSAVARQRTLRAVVDWSYELCSPEQRALWDAMSVFRGRFDLAAAAAVAERPEAEVVDILDDLVAQSVVEADRESGGFRMLETIRAYGRERSEEHGTRPSLLRRHLDHYRRLAERSHREWYGPHQRQIIAAQRADRAELHAALATAVAIDTDAALDLFGRLRYHWGVSGLLPEGRAWATRVLGLPGGGSVVRTRALLTAAWLCLLQGDLAEADELLTEAERLAPSAPPADAAQFAIEVHRWRGSHALFSGDPRRGAVEFARSIRLATDAGHPEEALLAQFQLTTARCHLGERGAGASAQAAVRHAEAIGEMWMRSLAMWSLALAAFCDGELDEAERYGRASLTADDGIDDPVGDCLALEILSWIDAARVPTERSAVLLGAARTRWRRVGSDISRLGPHLTAHHDRCLTQVRESLGERAFERAVSAGEQLSPAEAVSFAASAHGSGALSERESQVAAGIHAGLSNREIADRLVLSIRTVDTHVQRILAKLGFGSRTQIAAWFEATSPPPVDTLRIT
ncbi:LuxR C-terminal-related transcriptional regulator [Microbacterium sp. cx-55]|uniref:ATP-binding protein n=1 Tax=Microbacterium sp. cx-55 TaxID=2875948 RepID=UPI001CBD8455|nr:LuxR C-terminal-related transcriptional regulator [Microbacterium sp. cx-55]MBZ4488365.1 LuxR C-terminal-related transcriptional regulator [Microbacterium sp. cx-55]UGB35018.1 LuxR C-terminal-related transcriptional regulator [Microbacterium sp. cx-55]